MAARWLARRCAMQHKARRHGMKHFRASTWTASLRPLNCKGPYSPRVVLPQWQGRVIGCSHGGQAWLGG